MRVDYTFDKELLEANGYTIEDIYETIKREFASKNLPCVSDGEVLSFEGTGDKNDFSYMLVTIDKITQFEWFLAHATSCIWRRDENKWEDVLRQVRKEAGIEVQEIPVMKTTKKDEVHKVYEECRRVFEPSTDLFGEIEYIEDDVEKEFFVTLCNFFLQQGQKKTIAKGEF